MDGLSMVRKCYRNERQDFSNIRNRQECNQKRKGAPLLAHRWFPAAQDHIDAFDKHCRKYWQHAS